MKLYQSSQDYLETILMLSKKQEFVKSIDIARELNITKQSVHRAIKNLNENNYLSVGDKGHITLSESGLKVANEMLERHTVLTEYFIQLGVDKELAALDACNVEHYISTETFTAIKNNLNKIKKG